MVNVPCCIFCVWLVLFVLIFDCTKLYKSIAFLETHIEYMNDSWVVNVSHWLTHYDDDWSSCSFDATIIKEIASFPSTVELDRVVNGKRYPLPVNLSGDGCVLLKINGILTPDLIRAGFPKCPFTPGMVIHVRDLIFRPENFPNVLPTGVFYLTIISRCGDALLLKVGAKVKISLSKKEPPITEN